MTKKATKFHFDVNKYGDSDKRKCAVAVNIETKYFAKKKRCGCEKSKKNEKGRRSFIF